MPFPEFDPDKKKILFFSRGRGRGHAIPDIEIVKELHKLRDDVDVRFVSYATGARTLEEAGCPLIDLGLPEESAIADITVLAGRLIGWLNPDVVVSHEEFAVLPAAKIFDRRSVFVVDWFSGPDELAADFLRFADRVLFIGESEVFAEPSHLEGKVKYVGHVIRQFEYSRGDRLRAREELAIPANAFLVSVIPGGFATEERAPIADLVLAAFEQLQNPDKTLAWVAGRDKAYFEERSCRRSDVIVLESVEPIERLMAATDVAITKANRGATIDLISLGVPAIALSQALNPVDDRILTNLGGARLCLASSLDPSRLCEIIVREARSTCARAEPLKRDGARNCADQLSDLLRCEPRPAAPQSLDELNLDR